MATLTQQHANTVQTTAASRQRRRDMVDSALGSTLAEGVSPGPEVLQIFERFVDGELSMEEVSKLINLRYGL